jgi:hypothetical protein
MSILEYTFNLINEAGKQQKEEAPPGPEQDQEAPPQQKEQGPPPQEQPQQAPPQPPKQPPQKQKDPPSNVKVPSKIKSFISKMVKDFGPDGSASMDMKFMRKARETLGITGGKVSKVIEKIGDGATSDDIFADIKGSTDKY